MDLYLPSTEPGLTLQEMIDCDIKSGIDFSEGIDSMITSSDLNSLDLSGMSSLEAELDLKTFEPLFDPLIKLEDMDVVDDQISDELNAVNSWMNMSSMSNYNIDLENSIMVNPSAVLPTTLPSRVVKEELLNPLSNATISTTKSTLLIKAEPQDTPATSVQTPHSQLSNATTVTTQVTVMRPQTTVRQPGTQVSSQSISQSLAQSAVTAKPTLTTASQLVVQTAQRSVPQQINLSSSSVATTPTTSVITARTTTTHNVVNNRYKSAGKPRKDLRPEDRVFPKPAYSYSCLIALALKNSTTGSLPVSEIYSFMCEHFPYFRTAPNGWKNSVRHNLSLNKCFEKIEKPVAGSNQRKGCLWALNPAKAHKMDDEVQKWSKKDLQGIKDAMQYPEVLEALEGGEMKFEYTNCGVSSCSEDEDEDEEVDPLSIDASTPTVGTVKINPLTATTVVSNQRGGVQTQISQHARHSMQNIRTSLPANLTHTAQNQANIRPAFTSQSVKRSQVTSSDDTEFILPDSTMTEINLQTNGTVVDDLGNEIKVEEESSVTTNSSPRGLVVRKLPGITTLRSATVRANYVYTPSISSPHQQHHTLNRLVLTNGKLS